MVSKNSVHLWIFRSPFFKRHMTVLFSIPGDGSWRKRGFSSLFGLVTLIGWLTGKVLDVCVKSKYCKACEYRKKKEDTTEYEEWFDVHQLQCQINHVGSAGKIEVDAVVEMFRRSETLYETM